MLHQILRFNSGGFNSWGRIHQNKSWYSSGPSQASKVDFLRKLFLAVTVNFFVKATTWMLC